MCANRQPHIGVRCNLGDVAAHGAHHDACRNRAAVSFDADNTLAGADEAGDLGVLQHGDAALHGSLRVGPDHAVVAGCGRTHVIRSTKHGIATVASEVYLRTDLLDLLWAHHMGLGAARRVDHRSCSLGAHAGLGVRNPQQALGGVHDPTAGFVFEARIQLEAVLVEPHRFGDAVVGPDDGGVAARVARPDVVGLDDRHVGDAVLGGEVIGRGETMAATADNDHVVRTLGFVPLHFEQCFDELIHATRSIRSAAYGLAHSNRDRSLVSQILAGTPAT